MSKNLHPWSLHRGLSIAMLFGVALALLFDRFYEYSVVKSIEIEQEGLSRVREMSYALARDYSLLLMNNELQELRLSIGTRSTQSQIIKIAVSNEWGKVIASTNFNDHQKTIDQIDVLFNQDLYSQSISEKRTLTILSDNGKSVLSYTPVSLPPHKNELRSLRQGMLFVHIDIGFRKSAIWNHLFTTNSILRWLITFIMIILLLGYFLKHHLFIPLNHLAEMASRLGHGDWSAESHIDGNSELAKLGRIFNKMRQEILTDHESLVKSEKKLQALNKQLEVEASTDALTSLANRRRIIEIMQYEINIAERYGKDFSIIMMDIDYFKSINDKYGHDVGDTVLRQISTIISNNSRKSDTAGRWGGEEFLITCPETNLNEAGSLAELLRQYIEYHDFDVSSPVTASFGVATFKPECTKDQLIKWSDDALYLAKANNRNCVHISKT
ncbi:MAG: diguanylate cyclase [gamma proteobacterium symbiont of Taylorina sp.]|nr:diguanylate cyclase [gamma proteobacterium symbiont of Taylorina sp.]